MTGLLLAALVARAGTPLPPLSATGLVGGGRLVAYAPAGFDPLAQTRAPRARSLRADADLLARCGFRAVTTYGVSRSLQPVCRFFKRRGFRTVLVGIWDPHDTAEVRRAIRLRRCADGYVVGNEGLTFGRYTRVELDATIALVRRMTGRPVTTRETPQPYRDDPSLLAAGDWVFPNLHPWYAGASDPERACEWTIATRGDLLARAPAGLPVVVAETGLPTAGDPDTSEDRQRAFFECLEARGVPFAYFEAFDQPWKHDDAVAPHWGLFGADRVPKRWAALHSRAARVDPARPRD